MSRLRIRRVSELVKREVGEIVRRDVNSPTSGLITVTDAEVAADLKTAKIYYSVIGKAAQQQNAPALLLQHRTDIQQQMARAITLKYTPVLEFIRDNSLEHGDRILRILSEIEASQPEASQPKDTQPPEPAPQLHEPTRSRRKK